MSSSSSSPSKSKSSTVTSSWYYQELRRALTEQSFGIADFRITDCKSTSVSAKVALLEGITCTITISFRGYELVPCTTDLGRKSPNDIPTQTTFESLEELLQSVSPRYLERRAETLAAQLAIHHHHHIQAKQGL